KEMSHIKRGLFGAVTGIFAIAVLGACQITFVTPYDETFDQEITSTQKDVDALMSKISDNPAAPYSSFSADYAKVKNDLDALAVRANSHTNNTDTVASVGEIQSTFSAFQNRHSSNHVDKAFVDAELKNMNLQFQILMGQELAKKSGQQGSKQ